jgi:GT2 family glycosyltransferase
VTEIDAPYCSVIIVNYRTPQLAVEAGRSLLDQSKASIELIVLDNCSGDNSIDVLRLGLPEAIVIESDRNIGFAGGNNMAAQHATGRFILLLNPDTLVIDGAVDRLLAFAEQTPDCRIWGGVTLFADYTLNPTYCAAAPTLWSLTCQATGFTSLFPKNRWFNPSAPGNWVSFNDPYVEVVSGCFLLIERELWTQLGGFDEAFFMYCEETDMCIRGARCGAKPRVCSEAKIIHYGGASEAIFEDKVVRLMRGNMRFLILHFGSLRLTVARVLLAFWPISRSIVNTLLGCLGIQEAKLRAQVWTAVWRRRCEWSNG